MFEVGDKFTAVVELLVGDDIVQESGASWDKGVDLEIIHIWSDGDLEIEVDRTYWQIVSEAEFASILELGMVVRIEDGPTTGSTQNVVSIPQTPKIGSEGYLQDLANRTEQAMEQMDDKDVELQRLKMQNRSMKTALQIVAKQISENRSLTAEEVRIVGHVALTCDVFGD